MAFISDLIVHNVLQLRRRERLCRCNLERENGLCGAAVPLIRKSRCVIFNKYWRLNADELVKIRRRVLNQRRSMLQPCHVPNAPSVACKLAH